MTEPPIRLLEGTEASAAERALLEAGRSVPVVHYDVTAGAAKLHAALQAAAGAGAPVATTTTALAKTATLTKLAVVLVPTLGAAAAYYAMRATPAPIAPAGDAEIAAVAPTIETPQPPTGPTVEVAPHTTRDHEIAPTHEPIRTEHGRSSRRATRSTPRRSTVMTRNEQSAAPASVAVEPARTPAPTATPEPIEEEAELTPAPQAPAPVEPPDSINELRGIASARALIDRDPAAALGILQRLARVHPQGYFVEERAALMVLALAATDDEDAARKHAARFLKAYPTSPFADRVRNAVR